MVASLVVPHWKQSLLLILLKLLTKSASNFDNNRRYPKNRKPDTRKFPLWVSVLLQFSCDIVFIVSFYGNSHRLLLFFQSLLPQLYFHEDVTFKNRFYLTK